MFVVAILLSNAGRRPGFPEHPIGLPPVACRNTARFSGEGSENAFFYITFAAKSRALLL